MEIFVPESVYSVDPTDGTLIPRSSVNDVLPMSRIDHDGITRFAGMHRLDLAIFGEVLTDDGILSVDLLVLSSVGSGAFVATSNFLAKNTRNITVELAKKIITLSKPELSQLKVPEQITAAIQKSFSGLKPLTR